MLNNDPLNKLRAVVINNEAAPAVIIRLVGWEWEQNMSDFN